MAKTASSSKRFEGEMRLGGFAWKASALDGDGNLKRKPRLALQLVHDSAPPRVLTEFLVTAAGELLWIRLFDEDGTGTQWKGTARIGEFKVKPPSEEGDHPVVTVPLVLEDQDPVPAQQLVHWRIQQEAAKSRVVKLGLSLVQEALPFPQADAKG